MTLTPEAMRGTVKEDIEAALGRVAPDDARRITVAVTGANVTLSGTIGSWSARDLATRTAWATPGVRVVVDDLVLAD